MRIQDSGMPEQEYWETLFDAESILDAFGWSGQPTTRHVLEFGCGYGTFTSLLAKCFLGRVDSFDIDPNMITATRNRLAMQQSDHVHFHETDFVADELPALAKDADVAVLFHMMHLTEPLGFLSRVATHLRPGGMLAILHWRSDRETPRGPAIETRPTSTDIHRWSDHLNATSVSTIYIPHTPHHYAVAITLP